MHEHQPPTSQYCQLVLFSHTTLQIIVVCRSTFNVQRVLARTSFLQKKRLQSNTVNKPSPTSIDLLTSSKQLIECLRKTTLIYRESNPIQAQKRLMAQKEEVSKPWRNGHKDNLMQCLEPFERSCRTPKRSKTNS